MKIAKPEGMALADWRAHCLRRLMELSEDLTRLGEEVEKKDSAPAALRGRGRPRKSHQKMRLAEVLAERLLFGAAYREACLLMEGKKPRGLRGQITKEAADFMHKDVKTIQDMRKVSRRNRAR